MPRSEETGNRRKSASVLPNSTYSLTLTTFSVLLNRIDEKIRSKLFFSFKKILGPE